MTIKEGIEEMDAYFADVRDAAYAKIGNPYKKKRVETPVEIVEVVEATDDESNDSDAEYEVKYTFE